MHIRDVMSTDLRCCSATDHADRAAHLMWKHDIGALPVLDSDGKPIAMVTDRDIAMAAHLGRRRLDEIKVRDCMSSRLISCSSNDGLDVAEKLMSDHQVHRLPVIDKGKLAGVVTLHDIARATGQKAARAEQSAVLSTMLHISRPRHEAIEA